MKPSFSYQLLSKKENISNTSENIFETALVQALVGQASNCLINQASLSIGQE